MFSTEGELIVDIKNKREINAALTTIIKGLVDLKDAIDFEPEENINPFYEKAKE